MTLYLFHGLTIKVCDACVAGVTHDRLVRLYSLDIFSH